MEWILDDIKQRLLLRYKNDVVWGRIKMVEMIEALFILLTAKSKL